MSLTKSMSSKRPKSIANRRRRSRPKKNARSEILKTSIKVPVNLTDSSTAEEKGAEFASPISSLQQTESNKTSIEFNVHAGNAGNTDTTEYTRIGKSATVTPKSLDPAAIFPYSNKPHETRKKTIAEESKQWESLFDPQYTFGSFQQGIARPVNQYFYRGKWPLDEEDIMGMLPKVKKSNSSNPNDTPFSSSTNGEEQQVATATLFPPVPSPTLPNLEHLKLHMKESLNDNETLEGNTQIEILPCPSNSQFPVKVQIENEDLYRERLDLLRTIQNVGFNKELNDGTQDTPYKESAAARLQRQIKKKAEKIKRETLVDSSTEEEDEPEAEEQIESQIDDEFHGLHVAIAPEDFFGSSPLINRGEELQPLQEEEEKEEQLIPDYSSLASIDDYENISFHAPHKEHALHKEQEDCEKVEHVVEEPEIRRKNRPSFLYFAYGFLFPPLWIIGSLYVPSSRLERTTASKNIDKKWKKYSRNALFIFVMILITAIVLILVVKPEAVGFRNSNEVGYGEERVVFDEVDTSVAV